MAPTVRALQTLGLFCVFIAISRQQSAPTSNTTSTHSNSTVTTINGTTIITNYTSTSTNITYEWSNTTFSNSSSGNWSSSTSGNSSNGQWSNMTSGNATNGSWSSSTSGNSSNGQWSNMTSGNATNGGWSNSSTSTNITYEWNQTSWWSYMFTYQENVSWSFSEWYWYFQKSELTETNWNYTAWYLFTMANLQGGGFQCKESMIIQVENAVILNVFTSLNKSRENRTAACLSLKDSLMLSKKVLQECKDEEENEDLSIWASSSPFSVMRYSRLMHIKEFVSTYQLLCATSAADVNYGEEFAEIDIGYQEAGEQCNLRKVRDTFLSFSRLEMHWEDIRVCKEATMAVEAVTLSLASCNWEVRSSLSLLVLVIQNMRRTICTPPSCNVDYSDMCLINAELTLHDHEHEINGARILTSTSPTNSSVPWNLTLPLANATLENIRSTVCRNLKYTIACVTNHTIDCQNSIYSSISSRFNSLKTKFGQWCPDMVPAPKVCIIGPPPPEAEAPLRPNATQIIMTLGDNFWFSNPDLCQAAIQNNGSQELIQNYCSVTNLHCLLTPCNVSDPTCNKTTIQTCSREGMMCSMTSLNVSGISRVQYQGCVSASSCNNQLSTSKCCNFSLCNQLDISGTPLTCQCNISTARGLMAGNSTFNCNSSINQVANLIKGCFLSERQNLLNDSVLRQTVLKSCPDLENAILYAPSCGTVCPTMEQLKYQCNQSNGDYCQTNAVSCLNRAVLGCTKSQLSALTYGVVNLVASSSSCIKTVVKQVLQSSDLVIFNITSDALLYRECLYQMQAPSNSIANKIKSALLCLSDVEVKGHRELKVESWLSSLKLYFNDVNTSCSEDNNLQTSISKLAMSALTDSTDPSLCVNVQSVNNKWFNTCVNTSVSKENVTAAFSLVCPQDFQQVGCNLSNISSCFHKGDTVPKGMDYFQTLESCVKVAVSQCKGNIPLESLNLVRNLALAYGLNSSINISRNTSISVVQNGSCGCDPAAAINCIMDVHHMAKQPVPDWEGICPLVKESKNCAYSHVSDCEECKKSTVMSIVSKLNSQLEEECIEPPVTECPASRAMECVTDLSHFQEKSGLYGNESICIQISVARDCVSETTKNCDGLTMLAVSKSLEQVIQKWKNLKCDKPEEQLVTCVDVFKSRVYSVLGHNMYDLWEEMNTDNSSIGRQAMSLCEEIEVSWSCIRATLNMEKDDGSANIVKKMLTALHDILIPVCTPRKGPLQCYSCQGQGQNSCANGKEIETCQENEVCQTVTDAGQTKSRGCKPKPGCQPGCVTDKCNYCCEDKLCNYLDDGPLKDACNLTALASCVLDLSAEYVQRENFQCSSANVALGCLQKNQVECEQGGMTAIIESVNQLNISAEMHVCLIQEANQTCNIETVATTIQYIATNGLAMKEDELCHIINESRQAVDQASSLCTSEENLEIVRANKKLVSLIGKLNCSEKYNFSLEDTCRPIDALACVKATLGTEETLNLNNLTCQSFNDTVECMRQAVKGCTTSCQLVSVNKKIEWLKTQFQKICYTDVNITDTDLPQKDLAICISNFKANIRSGVNISSSLLNATSELQFCILSIDLEISDDTSIAYQLFIEIVANVVLEIQQSNINISIEISSSCTSSLGMLIGDHGVQALTMPYFSLSQRQIACGELDKQEIINATNSNCDAKVASVFLGLVDTIRENILTGFCPEIKPLPRCLIQRADECLARFNAYFGLNSGSEICIEASAFVDCVSTYTQSCDFDEVITFRQRLVVAVEIITLTCSEDTGLVTRARCKLLGRMDVAPGCSPNDVNKCTISGQPNCSKIEENAACITKYAGSCISNYSSLNTEIAEISKCRYGEDGNNNVILSSSCSKPPYKCDFDKALQCLLEANNHTFPLQEIYINATRRCLEEQFYCFSSLIQLMNQDIYIFNKLIVYIGKITPNWNLLESKQLIQLLRTPTFVAEFLEMKLSVDLFNWNLCYILDLISELLKNLETQNKDDIPAIDLSYNRVINAMQTLCDNLGPVAQELKFPGSGLESPNCPDLQLRGQLNLLISRAISDLYNPPKFTANSVCSLYQKIQASLDAGIDVGCSSGFSAQVRFTLVAAQTILGNTCESPESSQKRCDIHMVENCVKTLYNNFLALGKSQTVIGLCKIKEQTDICVERFSYKCDKCSLSRINWLYKSVKQSVDAKCTKEDDSLPDCKEDNQNDNLGSCDIGKAAKCSFNHIKNMAKFFWSKKAKCKSLNENLDCVQKNTRSCQIGHLPKFNLLDSDSVEKVEKFLGCMSDEPDVTLGCREGCWINRAKSCFEIFKQNVDLSILSRVTKDKCKYIDDLRSCVALNTKQCTNAESKLTLEWLDDTLQRLPGQDTVCVNVNQCAQDFDVLVRQLQDLQPEREVAVSSKARSLEQDVVDAESDDNEADSSFSSTELNLNTLCVRAGAAFNCLKRGLLDLPLEKQSVLITFYTSIWETVSTKCIDTREFTCYYCRNGNNADECRQNKETCPNNKRACMLSQTLTGNQIKFKAGCTKINACKNNGASATRTTCCSDSLCNFAGNTNSSIQPEPETCHFNSVLECALDFATHMFRAADVKCSDVAANLGCVQKYGYSCPQGNNLLTDTFKVYMRLARTQCVVNAASDDCNSLAVYSMQTLLSNAYINQGNAACLALNETTYSVNQLLASGTCSEAGKISLTQSLEFVTAIVGTLCSENKCLPSKTSSDVVEQPKCSGKIFSGIRNIFKGYDEVQKPQSNCGTCASHALKARQYLDRCNVTSFVTDKLNALDTKVQTTCNINPKPQFPEVCESACQTAQIISFAENVFKMITSPEGKGLKCWYLTQVQEAYNAYTGGCNSVQQMDVFNRIMNLFEEDIASCKSENQDFEFTLTIKIDIYYSAVVCQQSFRSAVAVTFFEGGHEDAFCAATKTFAACQWNLPDSVKDFILDPAQQLLAILNSFNVCGNLGNDRKRREVSTCQRGNLANIMSRISIPPQIATASLDSRNHLCQSIADDLRNAETLFTGCGDNLSAFEKQLYRAFTTNVLDLNEKLCPKLHFEEETCNLELMTQCREDFETCSLHALVEQDSLCRTGRFALDCINRFSKNCTGASKSMAEMISYETSMVVKQIVGNNCPLLTPYFYCNGSLTTIQPACQLDVAKACAKDSDFDFTKASNESFCQNLKDNVQCVQSAVTGCQADQIKALGWASKARSGFCGIQDASLNNTCLSTPVCSSKSLSDCFFVQQPTNCSSLQKASACMQALLANKQCSQSWGATIVHSYLSTYFENLSFSCNVAFNVTLPDAYSFSFVANFYNDVRTILSMRKASSAEAIYFLFSRLYINLKSANSISPIVTMIKYVSDKVFTYSANVTVIQYNSSTDQRFLDTATCSYSKARACISKQMLRTVTVNLLTVDEKNELCDEYSQNAVKQCVELALTNCPQADKDWFLSISTYTANMISKLEICDPIQLCVISEGYECVNKLGTILANYDRSNDKDALCMGRLKSQECVDQFVFKCSDAKAKPVKDAFKKLFDKVNDTCKDIELPPAPICPAIPERNRVCYLGNSFRCLADLNIKYLNTGDSLIWRRQCLEIQSMMVCVATNTTSCDAESGDVKAIRESLKDIRTTAYGQCPWMSDDLCSNEEICPVVNAGCEVDLERGMINGEKTVCELKQLADECIQRNTVTCNHAQKTQANSVLEKKLQALGFSKDLSCDNSSYDGCLYSFLSAARDIYVDSRRNVSCQLLRSQYNCIAMKISNPNNSSFIDLARNLLSELSKKLNATPCTVNVSSSCSQIPVRKLSELITQLLLNVQLHTTSFCAQSLAIIQEQKTGDCNSGIYDIIKNSSAFQQKCVGEVPSCPAAYTKIEECLGGNSASACLDQKGARCISQYLPANCVVDKKWYTQLCEHTVLLKVNGQQSSKNFISEAGLHSRFSWILIDGYRQFRIVMSAQPINSSTVPSCLQGSQVNDPIPQVCSDSNPKTLGNSSNEIAFNIYARQDYRMDGPQSVKLEFTVIPYRNVTNTTSGNEAYEDLLDASFKLTYIIEVDDTDALRSMCSSINDPHITTYDGSKYNNMNSGLYILHRHIKEAIAVLVQYQQCAAHGTCNCAVHVMAKKCKLSIDLCNPNTPLISFDAPKGTKDLPISLFVEKDQKTYSVVCLATGTIIKVVVDDPYMNVWILPSAADRGNAGGQCGDNNGDGNNDFQLPDSSRYVLVPEDSQFGVISPDFYNNAWKVSNVSDLASIFAPGVQITTEPLPEYCYLWSNSSTGTKPTCHQSAHLTTCGYVTGEDQSNKLLEMMNQMTSTGSKRKKRQAVAQEEEIVNTTRVAPGWPTPTGWTLEKATEYCMDNLYNPSLEACRETVLAMDETLKSFSLDDALRVCIDDIRLSDSTSWIQGARQVATQICIEEINRNPEYQKQSKTSDLAIAFMNTTCSPYDCSGKGKCYKGICLCDKDYVGTGCELSVGQLTPPTLTQPDEGVHMCEITATSDCSSIYITGKGFVGSSYLSCHIQEVEVAESGTRDVTSKITVVRADLLGTDLVRCDLGTKSTIKRSVKVSVSNDGKTPYPNYQYFIAYDPVCYECTMYSCIKNTDVCFIGTTCVSAGERSVYSECQYCDLKNPNKWSIDTGITGCKEDDNKHTTETMDVTTKALIAAGVTLLVLLIILVVALFIYYKRRDAARKREARQMHRHDNQAYLDQPPFYGQPVMAINTKPSSVKNNLLGPNSP